jgi:hypothetical protein
MMVTEMCKLLHLESLLAYSKELGAEVRYHPEHGYFTAIIWSDCDNAVDAGTALAVQRKIQRQAAQYPEIVCYCFDAFSTLVYAI